MSALSYSVVLQTPSPLSQRLLRPKAPFPCCNATFLANGSVPLRRGVLYQFLVTAINEAGPGIAPVASPFGRLGDAFPIAPAMMNATSYAPNTVTVTWAAVTDDGGSPVFRYDIVDLTGADVVYVSAVDPLPRYSGTYELPPRKSVEQCDGFVACMHWLSPLFVVIVNPVTATHLLTPVP